MDILVKTVVICIGLTLKNRGSLTFRRPSTYKLTGP